jgi:hypothetical protein
MIDGILTKHKRPSWGAFSFLIVWLSIGCHNARYAPH